MSLLDDVQRLIEDRPPRGGSVLRSQPRGLCYYCLGDGHGQPHAPDCPWLALPRIVKVIEAAERVVFRAHRPDTDRPGRPGYVDELRALAAALKGDVVPQEPETDPS